jgi:hypothetical protein
MFDNAIDLLVPAQAAPDRREATRSETTGSRHLCDEQRALRSLRWIASVTDSSIAAWTRRSGQTQQRLVRHSTSSSASWIASTSAGEDIVFSQTKRGLAGRVPWEKVLPPWLKVLSATAEPEEFAQRIVGLLKHHYDHDGSARRLAMARKIATRAQRQGLPKPEAPATPRRRHE